jgi:hypothetical protein
MNDDRWYIVVIRNADGSLSALSRRQPGPDGRPFAGPWGALTSAEAGELAGTWNASLPGDGSRAEVTELFRYDRDPAWPDEYA